MPNPPCRTVSKDHTLYFLEASPQIKKHFFNGSRSGLGLFVINTRISESGHMFAFLILLVLSLYIASTVDIRLAAAITLINVFFNFYPLVLQRYHRLRLKNMIP
jgi:hypothetical protein